MASYARNVNTIKNDNRALIFRYVRSGLVSRAEISKKSGMSKSAVTMITNALIEEGQLREIGHTDSSYGRKPILLDIVGDYRYAGGISLHRKRISVCITDLKSNIVAFCSCKTETWNNPFELLDWACDSLRTLVEEHGIPYEKIVGIGISSPGPLDYRNGIILTPPDFELFHNIPVGDYVREKLQKPVMLDNNSVLLTMQECLCDNRSYKNYMLIVVSDGIGSAIMNNGKIYRGNNGFAGEIGHSSIDVNGIPCTCGNRGCLEQYISMKALKKRFDFDSYEQLVDDSYVGDRAACEVLDYIAFNFSAAVVNAINFFDLDAVIIYGDFSYRHEKLLEMIREHVRTQSIICRVHAVDVRFSDIPPEKANASVTAAILGNYFNQNI